MAGDPFFIDSSSDATPWQRAAVTLARPLLSWVLALPTYRMLYERTPPCPGEPFDLRALRALDVRVQVCDEEIGRIPSRGPLLIASNHPHGILDGLVLAAAIRRARPDVRILANHILSRIPELADLCFFVDPFGGAAANTNSQAGLRAAHLWLRNGGALIVFPGGEVAHARDADGSLVESPWRSTAGRLALATSARVLPAFIDGSNSSVFYVAGRVHPALRTALLAREFLKKRGQTIAVRLGLTLATGKLRQSGNDDAVSVTESIRSAVMRLMPPGAQTEDGAPTRESMAREIAALPPDSCLVDSGGFRVCIAEAHQIPAVLREIGRLREVTYRAVGEGTGRKLDLDRFDDRYLHLFSWDASRRQIIGAYRLGRTDQILATEGIDGLYTRTLFRYDERLLTRLSPAVELGRSFVRAEYQKNYNALLLLWRGIGQFISRHPQYRVLFGPVSISARYSDTSHSLLMAFLKQNHLDRDLAELVEAIHPTAVTPPRAAIPRSADEANRMIAAAEADGKGLPILLRQYLKLNARLIGFNVDPQFGDALDALMMVDLTAVDRAILRRYFGGDQAARFLALHRVGEAAHAA